jgi:selenocysteine lyase/cysteine desulfurase
MIDIQKVGQSISRMFEPKIQTSFNTIEEKLSFIRSEKIGHNILFETPSFIEGNNSTERPLLHLDYTASAQGLNFIEDYIKRLMVFYANTHTETSETGRVSTNIFHESIEKIRKHVNAGSESFVIPIGSGATGAIERLQKIIGVNISPKCRQVIENLADIKLKEKASEKYVVFVGPYEHHSNDVSWQDNTLCEFVRIKSKSDDCNFTEIDYKHLDEELAKYSNHIKIGCFSAASNVTGIKTDVSRLSKTLKSHNALFFLDYAASGPYVEINMVRDNIDAIFLSAHKNIGGSNLGLLVGKNNIYDTTVAPSFGGGGTVQAVTPWAYHFHDDIEEREYSGTPAIRQTWQAALSFELKEWLGLKNIHQVEETNNRLFMDFFESSPLLEVLGNKDPNKRIGIFSFLIKHGNRYIHHNLVAALLNDLFGIQARSGCACAGPFGHDLLHIKKGDSDKFINLILNVKNGFKPGWTRIGAHFTLSNEEMEYVFNAIHAISAFGPLFINDYDFNAQTGSWTKANYKKKEITFGISDIFTQGHQPSKAPKNITYQFNQAIRHFTEAATQRVVEMFGLSGKPSSIANIRSTITQCLNEKTIQVDELIDRLIVSLGDNAESGSSERLKALFGTSEDSTKLFSDLNQVDEKVRFFYAPKLFNEKTSGDFWIEKPMKNCPNKGF